MLRHPTANSSHARSWISQKRTTLPYERLLARMAGVEGGVRDALTRHTRARTGAYYIIPPLAALAAARA